MTNASNMKFAPPASSNIPSDIFYVVAVEEPSSRKPKKMAHSRITYNNYVNTSSVGFTISKTPMLFKERHEAETVLASVRETLAANALKCKQTGEEPDDRVLSIVPLRVLESAWTEHYGGLDGDNYSRIHDARNVAFQMLHYDVVSAHVKKLAGKILTILDAAYVNENQNKAVKDLVKSSFRSQLGDLWNKAVEDPNCESSEGQAVPDILD